MPTGPAIQPPPDAEAGPQARRLRLSGTVPPELWNKLGLKIVPKLRTASDLRIGVEFSATLDSDAARSLVPELRLILQDLGLSDKLQIEDTETTE